MKLFATFVSKQITKLSLGPLQVRGIVSVVLHALNT